MQYHTGCDAHKKSCTFHHMTSDGTHGIHMNVATNKEQINQFLDLYDQPTTMTLEAGCNWWYLYHLFSDHPKVSEVNVVDPRRSRKIAEELSVLCGYGRASNDHIDSEMLAELRRRDLLKSNHIPTPEQMEVRTMNRFRLDSVFERTSSKNKIHAIMTLHGTSSKIDDLLERNDSFEKVMKRLPQYVQFVIDLLLKRINILDQQIETCESELNRLLPETHPQMRILISHPGVGPIFSRIMLTEILNIAYFKEPKYLVSFSGLAPVVCDSAGRRKGKVKLNRHCNYYLKYAFVSAAHNSRYHIKYRRKYELDAKRHGKMIAKFNLARRIINNIYWMLTNQQHFRE